MSLPDPTFPPMLTGHPVKAPLRPDSEACRGMSEERCYGAGDVFWARDMDTLRWSIVLEPEVPLKTAQQMAILAQVAIGDCLGALTPPKVAVTFDWPGDILLNSGKAGKVRATVERTTQIDQVPDWMVVSVELNLRRPANAPEPGETPDNTVLAEEGGENLDRSTIIESYSRHFLTWLNIWQDDGFKPVAEAWLFRAHGRENQVDFECDGSTHTGAMLGLDDNGDLLMKTAAGQTLLLPLLDHFGKA